MSSGKIRLNLEALRLKSFETTDGPNAERGTVKGMDCNEGFPGGCTYCTACTASCGMYSFCIGTCGGPSYCTGASQTDSGCQESWNGTCYETCYYTCETC